MDAADEAQRHEAAHLQAALARHHRPAEAQLVEDGEVICLGCGDPVPPSRLRVIPDAARCVDCQEILEAAL